MLNYFKSTYLYIETRPDEKGRKFAGAIYRELAMWAKTKMENNDVHDTKDKKNFTLIMFSVKYWRIAMILIFGDQDPFFMQKVALRAEGQIVQLMFKMRALSHLSLQKQN